MKDILKKCIHRHTILTHPNCFRDKPLDRHWYADKRICFLDIETSGLKANFDIMLTWSIKELGNGKVYTDTISKKDLFSGVYDRNIVSNLLQCLEKFDIIVTYNGTFFDIPFSRARADYWKLKFPGYGEKFHWDLYFRVKALYAVHRKSLAVITKFLGIVGKTDVDLDVWFKARFGDEKALKIVLDHNIQDVVILEKLYERIKGYSKWIKKSL